METEELRIQVPKGYEIDIKNSTPECIRFKLKNVTYTDINDKFFSQGHYYISGTGILHSDFPAVKNSNAALSVKQLEKLLAMNKLMNVAKYLNGDWKPNWSKGEYKYYIVITPGTEEIEISYTTTISSELVYFKTEQLALEAIHILGKSTILLALSTDW